MQLEFMNVNGSWLRVSAKNTSPSDKSLELVFEGLKFGDERAVRLWVSVVMCPDCHSEITSFGLSL